VRTFGSGLPSAQRADAPALEAAPPRWRVIAAVVRAGLARHPLLFELMALVMPLAILGVWMVPAHVATLWHNPEFIGWVVPIANRMAAGQRLYVDGGHTGMPPLPALLLLPLAGRAPWLLESAVHFFFQAATVVCIYLALRRHVPRPSALVAALATLPNFLSLQKAILYDPMAQFFVALIIQQLLVHLARNGGRRRDQPGVRWWRPLVVSGVATAALLFTKQSTAAGALAGVPVALVLARGLDARGRCSAVGVYLAAVALSVGLLLLLMIPWVSPAGFWADVVASGAELKGGRAALLASSKRFLAVILTSALAGPLPGGAIIAALVTLLVVARVRRAAPRELSELGVGALAAELRVALACVVAFSTMVVVTIWLDLRYGDQTLEALLLLAIEVVVLLRCLPAPAPAPGSFDFLFAALCVAVPAALGHNLSVQYLRWVYDNNPLVPIALAAVAALLCEAAQAVAPTMSRASLGALTLVLLQGMTSGRTVDRWTSLVSCTETWPEVHHLEGARVPRAAAGMRKLVKLVRKLTDARTDEVLLLPDDPDAHAWFDRRRPALTSQIIFTDQYQDRFVDEDARRLVAHPPKVIVIGPRNAWRTFSRIWHQDVGTERLIDRIQSDLLPARYGQATEVAISYHGRTDYMDVFLLKPEVATAVR
jgi:hypothetical protein